MGVMVTNDIKTDPLGFSLSKYSYGGSAGGGTAGAGIGGAMGAAALGLGALGHSILGNKNNDKSNPGKAVAGNVNTTPNMQLPNKNVNEESRFDGTPPIVDMTDDNTGVETVSPMDTSFDPYTWAKAMRDEEWAREDALRSHIEQREDNAYSRAIEDLRKSGVNINLLGNITPAGSGGGITNQTGSMDYTMSAAEYNKKMELLMQEIEQNFKGDENEKDRFTDLIRTLIMGGIMFSK